MLGLKRRVDPLRDLISDGKERPILYKLSLNILRRHSWLAAPQANTANG